MSFVVVLSFHAVDIVRGTAWQGISPIDAAGSTGVLVGLISAVFARKSNKGTPAG